LGRYFSPKERKRRDSVFRKMPKFEYFRPGSFEEAIHMLREYRGQIRPLAGGTDLFIDMKVKGAAWKNVLDLKGIPDADFIRETDGRIEIGSLANLHSVEVSPLIKKKIPLLAAAAGTIGSVQIRNQGTIGGNLCNAAPSADTAPALLCLGAKAEIIDESGISEIPLETFFLGPGRTVLGGATLLKKIIIPFPPPNTAGVYFKESPRRAMDLAVAGISCLLTLDVTRKKCIDCRIALGAVAPTPMRAKKAESVLVGKGITQKIVAAAGETASQETSPISDVRGSAEFRREMVRVFVKKGLGELCIGMGLNLV
jgi:CO/xanthine dehydrogenase FAD-binding subunit